MYLISTYHILSYLGVIPPQMDRPPQMDQYPAQGARCRGVAGPISPNHSDSTVGVHAILATIPWPCADPCACLLPCAVVRGPPRGPPQAPHRPSSAPVTLRRRGRGGRQRAPHPTRGAVSHERRFSRRDPMGHPTTTYPRRRLLLARCSPSTPPPPSLAPLRGALTPVAALAPGQAEPGAERPVFTTSRPGRPLTCPRSCRRPRRRAGAGGRGSPRWCPSSRGRWPRGRW